MLDQSSRILSNLEYISYLLIIVALIK